VRTEILFANNLESNCPPFHIISNYQRKDFQPTITTIFNKSLPSNIEVNNVSKFIAYFVGHHEVLLASEDFYNLWNFYKKLKKRRIQEFSDEEIFVVKIFYNEKWEIGTLNTTNIS
jgi:hypothetical protein